MFYTIGIRITGGMIIVGRQVVVEQEGYSIFGDLSRLLRQGGFVQSGKGGHGECELSYVGVYNQYCPNFKR